MSFVPALRRSSTVRNRGAYVGSLAGSQVSPEVVEAARRLVDRRAVDADDAAALMAALGIDSGSGEPA